MKKLILTVALAVSAVAFAGDAEELTHHFAEAPLSKLTLVYTVTSKGATTAMVEGPDGHDAVVREGDTLAKETLKVVGVSRGCLSLTNADGLPSKLCVDEPSTPRS